MKEKVSYCVGNSRNIPSWVFSKIIPAAMLLCCYGSMYGQVVVHHRVAVVSPRVYYPPVIRRPAVVVKPVPVVVVSPPSLVYTRVYVNGSTYYVNSGVFYIQTSEKEPYKEVAPPIGAQITSLPAEAVMITIEDKTYYQYKGIVYKKVIVESETIYEVVGS